MVAPRLTRRPALTPLDVRAEAADKAARRHWAGEAGCWCDERHEAGDPTLVAAPWDRPSGARTAAAR